MDIPSKNIHKKYIHTENISTVQGREIDWSEVGRRLTEVRGARTQVEFGRSLGVPQNFVSRYEHAKARPSVEYLAAVAELAGVTLDWLVLGYEPRDRSGESTESA